MRTHSISFRLYERQENGEITEANHSGLSLIMNSGIIEVN